MAGLTRHLGFNFYYYINRMARKFLLCFHDFSVWNFQKVVPYLRDLREPADAVLSWVGLLTVTRAMQYRTPSSSTVSICTVMLSSS